MKIAIHWFRRDLRWEDNTALYHALQGNLPVLCLFIFDSVILDSLPQQDRRVVFIHEQLQKLHLALQQQGSSLLVKYGRPQEVWEELLQTYDIGAVYCNRDYEPYPQERDKSIYALLSARQIVFKGYKDHVIFEKNEVSKSDGTPYTVFTPYSKRWKEMYLHHAPASYESVEHSRHFYPTSTPYHLPSLTDIGFEALNCDFPSADFPLSLIEKYAEQRNFPAYQSTTHLGIHFRFGTISIRQAVRLAMQKSMVWLNELIWRDFFQSILYHFPHTATQAFKPGYDSIQWLNRASDFEAWCNGKTGYPLVDAGMRELNATGFMHNRIRMLVASFLTKHLLIDWRWGEAYFAARLLDYDMAANVGGWQWAAGSGCDAAPYFRIFNPMLQANKFDPQQLYIKKWLPEWGTSAYAPPIVEHTIARARVLAAYRLALGK
mgnify:CR=1 FL=1|jgi:deoxyribodipyrimidine photo-lyase